MSGDDIGVKVASLPTTNSVARKPIYLTTLSQGKKEVFFLSQDRPELLPGFVQAKGFFIDRPQNEIVAEYADIIANVNKDQMVEVMLPTHRIQEIRNLIYKSK